MVKLKSISILILLCSAVLGLRAQQIETISVHSDVMNCDIPNIVILPADYDSTSVSYPVLYLLHGYTNDHNAWLRIQPALPELATRYGMIIVCPEGKSSWYWDSPVNPELKFETYITQELIKDIDTRYNTTDNKCGRAITGFSMGGHGGLWLAIRHQDLFGACGATSGGVDIRPFPDNWEMKRSLGEYQDNSKSWDEHTVINILPLIKPQLAIIFDCGTDDFFYQVNERLHEEMLYRHIKHDYITRPGGHDDAYWNNSINYQILFFANYFAETNKAHQNG